MILLTKFFVLTISVLLVVLSSCGRQTSTSEDAVMVPETVSIDQVSKNDIELRKAHTSERDDVVPEGALRVVLKNVIAVGDAVIDCDFIIHNDGERAVSLVNGLCTWGGSQLELHIVTADGTSITFEQRMARRSVAKLQPCVIRPGQSYHILYRLWAKETIAWSAMPQHYRVNNYDKRESLVNSEQWLKYPLTIKGVLKTESQQYINATINWMGCIESPTLVVNISK